MNYVRNNYKLESNIVKKIHLVLNVNFSSSPGPAQIGLHSALKNPKITSPKWRNSNITSTSLPTRKTSVSRRLRWTLRMPRSSTSSSCFFSFRSSTSNSSITTTTPSYPPHPSECNHNHIYLFYIGKSKMSARVQVKIVMMIHEMLFDSCIYCLYLYASRVPTEMQQTSTNPGPSPSQTISTCSTMSSNQNGPSRQSQPTVGGAKPSTLPVNLDEFKVSNSCYSFPHFQTFLHVAELTSVYLSSRLPNSNKSSNWEVWQYQALKMISSNDWKTTRNRTVVPQQLQKLPRLSYPVLSSNKWKMLKCPPFP